MHPGRITRVITVNVICYRVNKGMHSRRYAANNTMTIMYAANNTMMITNLYTYNTPSAIYTTHAQLVGFLQHACVTDITSCLRNLRLIGRVNSELLRIHRATSIATLHSSTTIGLIRVCIPYYSMTISILVNTRSSLVL